MFRLIVAVLVASLAAGAAHAQSGPPSRFEGWTAAIIAADWRTSAGQPIQAFDNARRDLTSGFLGAGFSRSNLVDVTLRPDVETPTTAAEVVEAIAAVAARAPRGCLLYFTSHGGAQGIVFGADTILNPTSMASLVRTLCQDRPTVVVISACFSGIFVDALSEPNRMIMTAARRDRSSFGCSEDATYPYFDGCVIASLPAASDFIALANATRACVKAREEAEGLAPGSEPQVFVGGDMQVLLPTLRFTHPPG